MGILHDLKEVISKLKYKGSLQSSRKYCPRCGSPKLKVKINWFIVPSQVYECLECGYKGPIFMEKESEKSS